MFYMHALGLPLLLLNNQRGGGSGWRHLGEQVRRWNRTKEPILSLLGVSSIATSGTASTTGGATSFGAVPILWIYLSTCVLLNYCSGMASAKIVGLSSSVILNLVLTASRFLSLVISACLVNAPPYPLPLMWVGSALLVTGCTSFVLAPNNKEKKD